MKPKTYAGEAVIDAPNGLLLGPEFMGVLKRATIAGVEVHVVLPSFGVGASGQFETRLHPRAKVDWVASFATDRSEADPGWPFGRVVSWQGKREVLQISVARLLVLPRGPVTLAEARNLKREVDDWIGRLETWIEVVTREDLQREWIKVDHVGKAARVWIDQGGGKLSSASRTLRSILEEVSRSRPGSGEKCWGKPVTACGHPRPMSSCGMRGMRGT